MNMTDNNFERTNFLFRTPFEPKQQAKAVQNCMESINRDLDFIKSHGFDEFTKLRAKETLEEDEPAVDKEEEENLGATFEGTLRDYQIYMLERAKVENTIVHLGTGMGKTLISIMLMKDFLSARKNDDEKKHILFLVPSIALAVQHTDSLKANLPCKVVTACHTSSNSSRAREDIAAADVVVATHGAAKDLLTHYSDVLSLEKVSLLVIDECHYATGNHNYATILQKFYHSLPQDKRPRILGLTASPLINVSVSTNDAKLQNLLTEFENMMDAKLIGFPSGSSSKSDVEQAVIEYSSNDSIRLPSGDGWMLHRSREKEVKQLQRLLNDVGPSVTAVYALTLAREISRNEFEQETIEQCDNLKSYLLHVVRFLEECIAAGMAGEDGHTDKMRKLESLLESVLKADETLERSPVGIVFVEMRITAIALNAYFLLKKKNQGTTSKSDSSSASDQNDEIPANADDDESVHFINDSDRAMDVEPGHIHSCVNALIRCDVAVRKPTHIFKYLSKKSSLDEQQHLVLENDWIHQTTRIRSIIRKLRHRETNVLFATSIVEEGVDVEACSFVVSFDPIKTVKSYIQMKGRARQQSAKFYLFSDTSVNETLSLVNAQTVERIVHRFIAHREEEYIRDFNTSPSNLADCTLECAEEKAMHNEEYTTKMSSVDLSSSKSLLNRYALSVPVDPSCRTSKQAILLHMPLYKEHTLTLPSHIPPDVRVITLPTLFHGGSRKRKQSLMALAAIVRLHKLGLLNDRLLPLSDVDMKRWLIENALTDLPPCKIIPSLSFDTSRKIHVYKLSQYGDRFSEEKKMLSRGKMSVSLALVSPCVLPDNLPAMTYRHKELGCIESNFVYRGTAQLSEDQWLILTDFHCVLFNVRWRRKSKSKWFSFNDDISEETRNPYVIGCLDDNDRLHWDYIETVLDEFGRTIECRKQAVLDGMTSPRVCCPTYNPNASYILFGASGKTCRDEFVSSEYDSFKQYYHDKYCLEIKPDGKMYHARRLWELPQSTNDSGSIVLKNIPLVDVPQELFTEAIVADPMLMLHSVVLPQVLYRLEQHLTCTSFIKHALHNYPVLGRCISGLPIEYIAEALIAKSCSEKMSYDRLEWLGDAVLKLLHTDALLKWKRTSFLHEGYLSLLRSAMGSNERLHNCAMITGISNSILLSPLNRGEWIPCGLCNTNAETGEKDVSRHTPKPSKKVCADVIESLLGLVYLHSGIKDAMDVACELGVSFNYGDAEDSESRSWSQQFHVDRSLIDFASHFLGVQELNMQLLIEATTHQSCLHKPVPSYQRLEWVGDAVLCLAIRECLFRLDRNLTVPKLVVLETTLECNETLAFLGLKSGVCKYIDHRDRRLPGRFEAFERDLKMLGRGLWSTDPPKVIPDVVEALIGVAHVDLGFEQGQKAALNVIRPIIQSMSSQHMPLDRLFCHPIGILHPKQHLYEMTSGIVRVRAYKHERFHRMGISSLSLENKTEPNGYIGVVSCKGLFISIVCESSSRAAINVACSLAVDLLSSNPTILAKLHDIHLIATK